MISEAVKLARVNLQIERTKQYGQVAHDLATSPLMQAVAVWLIVEAAQTYGGFGTISGTVLEGASVVKMFNIEKTAEDIGKLSAAFAPLLIRAAAAA